MKLNRILAAGLLGMALFAASSAEACTNFLFTNPQPEEEAAVISVVK